MKMTSYVFLGMLALAVVVPVSAKPGELWTPAEITNGTVIAWYDAADAGTLWANTAGTTPATGTDAVSRWDDKSGNGQNFISTVTPRTGSSIGSLNALFFNRHDMTASGVTAPASGNLNVFIVYDFTREQVDSSAILSWSNPGWSLESRGGASFAPLTVSDGIGGNRWWSGGPYNDSAIFGCRFDWDSNEHTGWVNGENKTSTPGTYSTKISGTALRVGKDAVNRRLYGYVGEIICIEDITTKTQQMIEGYLAWKWGLEGNLPEDHRYKSARPMVPLKGMVLIFQ